MDQSKRKKKFKLEDTWSNDFTHEVENENIGEETKDQSEQI